MQASPIIANEPKDKESKASETKAIKPLLFLIPVPLGTQDPCEVLAPVVIKTVLALDHFVVENEKSAWRFLSQIKDRSALDRVKLSILDEHTNKNDVEKLLNPIKEGNSLGIISEAGMPCIADPGALLVAAAHRKKIEVKALPGPSSIVLSVASSGFSGQSFTFWGYLPQDSGARKNRLKELERVVKNTGQTQVFIETPYRNEHMIEDMLLFLQEDTNICACADLNQESELVLSGTVGFFKKNKPTIGKRPCIFLIGAV